MDKCVLIRGGRAWTPDFENNFTPYKSKLFCPCGFDGESAINTEKCPSCERAIDIRFTVDKESHDATGHQIFESDDTISLIIQMREYRSEAKRPELLSLQVRPYTASLVHNFKTGESYFRLDENTIDLTYGGFCSGHPNEFMIPFHFFVAEKEAISKFLTKTFEKRGIIHVEPSKFTKFEGVVNACIYLRYPQLQNIPYQTFISIPEEYREALDNASKGSDIWNVFTKQTAASLRKAGNMEGSFKAVLALSSHFEKIDNLVYLLSHFKDDQGSELFHPIEIKHGGEYRFFKKSFKFLKKLHSDERVLARKLVKALSLDGRKFTFSEMNRYIRDIHRMYNTLKKEDPEYNPSYRDDIRRYHDDISRDYARYEALKNENTSIPYQNGEEDWQGIVDDFYFELALDTNKLLEVGVLLSICVGSYRDQALSGRSIIVFVKNKNNQYEACLEVQNKKLVQAKVYSNKFPEGALKNVIEKWAELHGIEKETCFDLSTA